MTFPQNIFAQLEAAGDGTIIEELSEAGPVRASGAELLQLIAQARAFLAAKGLKKGDRCALLASNGIRWIAMDLAIIAEGLIVVPLYPRQAPAAARRSRSRVLPWDPARHQQTAITQST